MNLILASLASMEGITIKRKDVKGSRDGSGGGEANCDCLHVWKERERLRHAACVTARGRVQKEAANERESLEGGIRVRA